MRAEDLASKRDMFGNTDVTSLSIHYRNLQRLSGVPEHPNCAPLGSLRREIERMSGIVLRYLLDKGERVPIVNDSAHSQKRFDHPKDR
jgi:hypothetical protein